MTTCANNGAQLKTGVLIMHEKFKDIALAVALGVMFAAFMFAGV